MFCCHVAEALSEVSGADSLLTKPSVFINGTNRRGKLILAVVEASNANPKSSAIWLEVPAVSRTDKSKFSAPPKTFLDKRLRLGETPIVR